MKDGGETAAESVCQYIATIFVQISKYLEISIHVKEQFGDFCMLILFAKRVKMCLKSY